MYFLSFLSKTAHHPVLTQPLGVAKCGAAAANAGAWHGNAVACAKAALGGWVALGLVAGCWGHERVKV